MAWFKVDDKLHDHRKARKAGKAAMGVWALAGSWCMSTENDGFVPEAILVRWGNKSDAARLVEAGLWYPDSHEGEAGWRFHDWLKYQPDARTLRMVREAESAAGSKGNHMRWHVRRNVIDPECGWCAKRQEENAS